MRTNFTRTTQSLLLCWFEIDKEARASCMNIHEDMKTQGKKGSDGCVVALTAETILGLTEGTTTQGTFEPPDTTHSHDKKDPKATANQVSCYEKTSGREGQSSATIREMHKQASQDDNSSAASGHDQPVLERHDQPTPQLPGAVRVDGINSGNASNEGTVQLLDAHSTTLEESTSPQWVTPLTRDELHNEVLENIAVSADVQNVSQVKIHHTRQRIAIGACLLVATVVVVVVVVVVLAGRPQDDPETLPRDLFQVLVEASESIYTDRVRNPLDDESSLQHEAYLWMMENMPQKFAEDQDETRWITIYALYVVYYSLNGLGWDGFSQTGINFVSGVFDGSEAWVESQAPFDFCSFFSNYNDTPNLSRDFPVTTCDDSVPQNLIGLAMDNIGNLRGTLPHEVGLLTNLKFLSMQSNEISGSIPESIGQLTNLQLLVFGQNDLTGTLPTELGLLTNMVDISVARNQFTGTIPTELGRMSSLRGMEAQINSLSGDVPESVCDVIERSQLEANRGVFWFDCPLWNDCSVIDCTSSCSHNDFECVPR